MSKDSEEGFLTTGDREFLQDQYGYHTGDSARQSRYEARERIAERARQAFSDFAYLFQHLDASERNRIFDPGGGGGQDGILEMRRSLVGTIAFLYLSLEGEADSLKHWDRSYRDPFERILDEGIKKAEVERHRFRKSEDTHYRSASGGDDPPTVEDIERKGMPPRRVEVTFDVDVKTAPIEFSQEAIQKIAAHSYHELTEGEMQVLLRNLDPAYQEIYDRGWEDIVEEIEEQRGIDRSG